MIINAIYDLCLQSTSWYLQLQLIRNRWPPWKRVSNSIDEEPEPFIYRTWIGHEPNFLKYSEPEQNQTLIIKEPELNTNPKFWVLSHLWLWHCDVRISLAHVTRHVSYVTGYVVSYDQQEWSILINENLPHSVVTSAITLCVTIKNSLISKLHI